MPKAPAADLEVKIVEFKGLKLEVKQTFKVHKFFKVLEESPFRAIDMLLTEESSNELDELEFTVPELSELLNSIVNALGVNDLKN